MEGKNVHPPLPDIAFNELLYAACIYIVPTASKPGCGKSKHTSVTLRPVWIYAINQKQYFKHMNGHRQDQDIPTELAECPHCSHLDQKNHSTRGCWGQRIVTGQCVSYTAMTSGAAWVLLQAVLHPFVIIICCFGLTALFCHSGIFNWERCIKFWWILGFVGYNLLLPQIYVVWQYFWSVSSWRQVAVQ